MTTHTTFFFRDGVQIARTYHRQKQLSTVTKWAFNRLKKLGGDTCITQEGKRDGMVS